MAGETCPTVDSIVDERLKKILTQYRESPNFIFLLRTYLSKIAETSLEICDLPEKFDIDTAVGDQLTIIGKRLGWPRCHCVCDVQPVFGFDCENTSTLQPVSGFCDASVSWSSCDTAGLGFVCIDDDEIYRKFLRVRSHQITRRYDWESLTECAKIFFGAKAEILQAKNKKIILAPNRDLTESEIALLQLYPRVLPTALGIETLFNFGESRVFGFGEGWGGFCEPWVDSAQILVSQDGAVLADENGNDIITGPLTRGAFWMCPVDVRPYDC